MNEALLISSFEYKGRHVDVEWFEVASKNHLPDIAWQQVYVIGNLDGCVPVVHYSDGKENLPGGKVERGETVEQALIREIEEEINCRVHNWRPLGYQKCIEEGKQDIYQLRVYAELEKIDEFIEDPGGSVIGYHCVPIDRLNETIDYGRVGERLVLLARKHGF